MNTMRFFHAAPSQTGPARPTPLGSYSQAVLALALLGIGLAGCNNASSSSPQTFAVGVVDVERILPKLTEYNQAGDKYLNERKELFKGLSPKATKAEMDRFLTPEKRREIQQSEQKWEEYKAKLKDDTVEKVRASAAVVAKDKHLGLVLVTTPWKPLSQRMGVDVTTDVLIDMQNSGKAAR